MYGQFYQSVNDAEALRNRRAAPAAPTTNSAPPSAATSVTTTRHSDPALRPSRPRDHPAALPCLLTTQYCGRPVMGTAVIDTEMPVDLPLELVPPEEAATAAPRMMRKGGFFIFSDAYVKKHPTSKIASMVRQFSQLKGGESDDGEAKTAAKDKSKATTNTIDGSCVSPSKPEAPPSPSAAPKDKVEQVRDFIKEAQSIDRPLFRRQKSLNAYGQSSYVKRDFHTVMDDLIEYII